MRHEKTANLLRNIFPHLFIFATMTFVFRTMLLEKSQFFVDWVNSYWLILVAQANPQPQWTMGVISGLTPLEPWQLYYGGNWYALVGRVADLANAIGVSTLQVYRVSFVVLAYLATASLFEILKNFGLHKAVSLFISLAGFTNAYYITNAAGRGAYTEFAASSLITPIALALVLHIKSANQKISFPAGIVFTALLALFLTTHNLSILMTFLYISSLACLSALVFGVGDLRRSRSVIATWKLRLCSTFVLVAAAVLLVSPTFLVVLFTGANTILGKPSWVPFTEFSSIEIALLPFPFTAPTSTTPDLKTQTASLLLYLTLGSIGYLVIRRWISLRLVLFSVLVLVSSTVVTSSQLFWQYAPDFLQTIQYSYRYVTYLTLSVVIVSALAFKHLQRNSKTTIERKVNSCFVIALLFVAAISAITAHWQVGKAQLEKEQVDLRKLSSTMFPSTWYAPFGFRQLGSGEAEQSNIEVVTETSQHVTIRVKCEQRTVHKVAVASSPLMGVRGAALIGSTSDGLVVLHIPECSNADHSQVVLSIGPTTRMFKVLRLTSLFAYFLLIAVSYWINRRRLEQLEIDIL